MCGASPLPFNVLPLVLGPVNAEFGWDFAQIAAGVTVFGLIASFLAPLIGGLADRIGVRPVGLWSLALFSAVFAGFYFVPPTLTGWYIFWGALGVIGIGSTPVTWSRAVSMWFSRQRGLALAIMLIGTSIAALTVPQFAKWAIDTHGWRAAFPFVALLPLLLALPVAIAWFREPRPDERPTDVGDATGALYGLELKEALRGYRFYALFASILLIALAYGGAHIHMAQIMTLKGHTELVATALGVVGIGLMVGRLGIGWLFDRVWAPGVAFPALALPAIACLILVSSDAPSAAVALTAAFLLGFAAGAESDVIAFLAAKYFGMKRYGRIYGFLYMPFGIGSAISPILYGVVRDRTGSYDGMLSVAAGLFVAGGALLLTLGRYPQWGGRDGDAGISA